MFINSLDQVDLQWHCKLGDYRHVDLVWLFLAWYTKITQIIYVTKFRQSFLITRTMSL